MLRAHGYNVKCEEYLAVRNTHSIKHVKAIINLLNQGIDKEVLLLSSNLTLLQRKDENKGDLEIDGAPARSIHRPSIIRLRI